MGVAYNADLHYSDYDTLKSGYSDYAAHYAAALDGAPSKTAASNHSYGVVGTNIQTVINYRDNNNVSITVSGESFTGTFDGLELEDQDGNTDACSYDIQGQINSNNITMSYTIYIEGENGLEEYDSCDAILTLSLIHI